MPLVSVVMPAFNAGAALKQAIASVIAQTMSDFELIVVDDCSTDGSCDFLDHSFDDRVKVVRNTINIGAAASRNRALQEAQGEFIAILDADDLMHPFRLELQVAFLDAHPQVAVVAGGTWHFDANGIGAVSLPLTTHAGLALGLRFGPSFNHGSVMVRRCAVLSVDGYRTEREPTEDYDLYARLLARGYRFGSIPTVAVLYRGNPSGLSRTRSDKQRREHMAISAEVRAANHFPGLREIVEAARREPIEIDGGQRLRLLKLLGRTCLETWRRNPLLAARYALAALAVGPRTWAKLVRDYSTDAWRRGRLRDRADPRAGLTTSRRNAHRAGADLRPEAMLPPIQRKP